MSWQPRGAGPSPDRRIPLAADPVPPRRVPTPSTASGADPAGIRWLKQCARLHRCFSDPVLGPDRGCLRS
jgi:hypothetical protein